MPTESHDYWVRALLETDTGRTGLTVQAIEPVEGGVEVIAGLQYPDIWGQPRAGKLKLYLPSALEASPYLRLPLVHNAGYELDRAGGEGWLRSGVIASTPTGEEPNPLVRGENLDVAILHRVRGLPCIDDAKVAVMGGSAGGYMTLMLAAETFPLIAAQPDVPPVNVGYNCAYIVANKPLAAAQPEGQEFPNMPVLLAVAEIGEGATAILGSDYSSESWLNAGPIARLAAITCPTLITVSTADMLVPVNQFGDAFVRPFASGDFPEGFSLDMDRFLPRPEARLKLLDVVPEADLEVYVVLQRPDAPKLGPDGTPEFPELPDLPIPFSTEKRFSLVVIDEGPVEPHVGHFKRLANLRREAFREWSLARPADAGQLTEAKLRRLLDRYLGRETYPQAVERDGETVQLNRLDFPEAEQADVLRGLQTFCADPVEAERLQALIEGLPPELRETGAAIAAGVAER